MTDADMLQKLNETVGGGVEADYLQFVPTDPARVPDFIRELARDLEISQKDFESILYLRGITHAKALDYQKNDPEYRARMDAAMHKRSAESRAETIKIDAALRYVYDLGDEDAAKIANELGVTVRRVESRFSSVQYARSIGEKPDQYGVLQPAANLVSSGLSTAYVVGIIFLLLMAGAALFQSFF